MRVIAGRWRGTRLVFRGKKGVRPSTDRVKETLFNILSPWLPEARVLDLFAGTGSWGIEALSRGSKEVIFVEKSPQMVSNLRENLERIGSPVATRLIRADAFQFLHQNPEENRFDLILADPPYRLQFGTRLLIVLSGNFVLSQGGIFVLKHSSREEIEIPQPFECFREKTFGETRLSFFRYRND
jgi:16S rRNA (guanine966-N2)-methyltransferase